MVADQEKEEPVLNDNGKLKEFTIRIDGKLAKCPNNCGCNVFHKPDKNEQNLYRCNGCKVYFEAT